MLLFITFDARFCACVSDFILSKTNHDVNNNKRSNVEPNVADNGNWMMSFR